MEANLILALSTQIILLPHISSAAKCVMSKFLMTSPASGQSTFTPVSNPPTKTPIYLNSPSHTSYPSSTYLLMVQAVKSSTPSIIRPVWDALTVRPLNKSGLTSTSLLYPHERWVLVPGTPHSMTAGVVGIGGRSSDLVSTMLSHGSVRHQYTDIYF